MQQRVSHWGFFLALPYFFRVRNKSWSNKFGLSLSRKFHVLASELESILDLNALKVIPKKSSRADTFCNRLILAQHDSRHEPAPLFLSSKNFTFALLESESKRPVIHSWIHIAQHFWVYLVYFLTSLLMMSLRIDFTEVQNLWERRQEKFSVSPNWGGTVATMSQCQQTVVGFCLTIRNSWGKIF